MDNLKDKTVLCWDNGYYAETAKRLARDFKKVYYYLPIATKFPSAKFKYVGSGIKGVERVYSFWDYVDKADLIFFPDTNDGDLQAYLRSKGKRVFGLGKAEWLENDRWKAREYQDSQAMPVVNAVKITGLDNLRKHVAGKKNLWIKVSYWRGNMETFHHINDFCSEPFFDQLQHKLGAMSPLMEFVVEDNLDAIECGFDSFTMDGNFPRNTMFGWEVKDLCYCGRVTTYDKIPPQLWYSNSGIAPMLAKEHSRGFFSTEVRIDKNRVPYLTDITLRAPSPPYELEIEIVKNLSDVVWGIAGGEMVEPEYASKYGASITISSDWATKDWMPVKIPKENRDFVKLANLAVIDGKEYVVPLFEHVEMSEIGAVVGFGDTIEAAIADAEKHAEGIEGHRIDIKKDATKTALETIKTGKEYGILF